MQAKSNSQLGRSCFPALQDRRNCFPFVIGRDILIYVALSTN